jgi:predicted transcriptional regulator
MKYQRDLPERRVVQSFTLPPELRDRLVMRATKRGTTLSALAVEALEDLLTKEDRREKKTDRVGAGIGGGRA